MSDEFLQRDMGLGIVAIECNYPDDHLNNEERNNTVATVYPGNGYFYIALTSQTFINFVCKWILLVSDCYILCSRSQSATFKTFSVQYVLVVIYNIDEEELHDVFPISSGAEVNAEPSLTCLKYDDVGD